MQEHTVPRTRVWDLPVRIFHWTLALSFAGAYLLGDSERWRNVHVTLGYTVLGLLVFRFVWGFAGTVHARFGSFAYSPVAALRFLRDELTGRARHYLGHNPAGSWAVYGLLLLGAATGVSGLLMFNGIGGEAFEEVHEVCANAWLALVVVHIAGIVFSSVMQRQNLVRAMVTGYKGATPDARSVRPLHALGVTLAAAVLGFWTWNLGWNAPVAGDAAVTRLGGAGHSGLAEEHESDDD
jgi:cytochrome b